MKRFSQLIVVIVAVLVLSWFLPWLWALCFPAPSNQPFCAFSPLSNKWVVSFSSPGERTIIQSIDSVTPGGIPLATTEITREQRDSLIPQMFYKQLVSQGRLPDSINGIEVTPHLLRSNEMMVTSSPRDVVKRTPGVWLMMESMPERVELNEADQVFRFTKDGRMEFVDMATNTVNAKRSQRFTELLRRLDFKFPAIDLNANVTSRKNYDEGYLMIDAEGKLFHIKQQAGRPYAAAVKMPDGVKGAKAFIIEETNRDILGLVFDTEGRAYYLYHDGYRLVPIAGVKADASKDAIMMMSNLFNSAFRISSNDSIRWYAIAGNDVDGYSLLGRYTFAKAKSAASVVASYIFPFHLQFVSSNDSLAYPRIGGLSTNALWLNILLAFVLIFKHRRRITAPVGIGALLTIGLGLFLFIPLMVLKD